MKTFQNKHGYIEFCFEDEDYEPSFDKKKTVYIDFIEAFETGKGHGKTLLNDFIKKVTREHKVKNITLIASEEYGTPIEKLCKFYKSFGFEEIHKTNFGIDMEKRIS